MAPGAKRRKTASEAEMSSTEGGLAPSIRGSVCHRAIRRSTLPRTGRKDAGSSSEYIFFPGTRSVLLSRTGDEGGISIIARPGACQMAPAASTARTLFLIASELRPKIRGRPRDPMSVETAARRQVGDGGEEEAGSRFSRAKNSRQGFQVFRNRSQPVRRDLR